MNNIFIKISFIRKKLLMQMCIFYITVSWLISQQWYWFKPRKLSRLHKACFTSRQTSLKVIIICSSANSVNEGFVRLIQTWFKVTHEFLNVCESFESFVHESLYVFNSLKSIYSYESFDCQSDNLEIRDFFPSFQGTVFFISSH